jgi:excisionase family DNA binding protein
VETGTEREWLTLREMQEMLGIGSTKAYELVTMPGGIPNVRIGRAIRINKRELTNWLEQQKYQDVND